jgi:hypothetical protein
MFISINKLWKIEQIYIKEKKAELQGQLWLMMLLHNLQKNRWRWAGTGGWQRTWNLCLVTRKYIEVDGANDTALSLHLGGRTVGTRIQWVPTLASSLRPRSRSSWSRLTASSSWMLLVANHPPQVCQPLLFSACYKAVCYHSVVGYPWVSWLVSVPNTHLHSISPVVPTTGLDCKDLIAPAQNIKSTSKSDSTLQIWHY